jgi:hypothetical protein
MRGPEVYRQSVGAGHRTTPDAVTLAGLLVQAKAIATGASLVWVAGGEARVGVSESPGRFGVRSLTSCLWVVRMGGVDQTKVFPAGRAGTSGDVRAPEMAVHDF